MRCRRITSFLPVLKCKSVKNEVLLNEENTCFISIPLVKNKRINKMDFEVFDVFFHQKNFISDVRLLLKQKKLFTSIYFYRLIYLSLKNQGFRNFFIKFVKEKLSRH